MNQTCKLVIHLADIWLLTTILIIQLAAHNTINASQLVILEQTHYKVCVLNDQIQVKLLLSIFPFLISRKAHTATFPLTSTQQHFINTSLQTPICPRQTSITRGHMFQPVDQ